MEKVTTQQDDNLLEYLDGRLQGPALSQLKKDLEGSPGLQRRLDELREVHLSLSKGKLESPSPDFVRHVMAGLHSGSSLRSISPRNGLLLVLGVLVASGILAFIVSSGSFDKWTGLITLEQAAPVKKYFQSLPTFHFNGKILINCLIALNLVLAMVVLDRTVLKPFFQRRSMSH